MNTWSKYGKLAEYLVANYLLNKGYNVRVSRNSKGAADILAWNDYNRLLIQVKATSRSPYIKGHEINRLINIANDNAIVAIVNIYNNNIEFYKVHNWLKITIE